jgi:hypothetical protein
MQSDAAKALLRRAAWSRAQRADGLQPWRVSEHPDWSDRASTAAGEKAGGTEEEEEDVDQAVGESSGRATVQDVPKILESFQIAHPDVKVELIQEKNVITVSC